MLDYEAHYIVSHCNNNDSIYCCLRAFVDSTMMYNITYMQTIVYVISLHSIVVFFMRCYNTRALFVIASIHFVR